jgi:hypothetical protein
MNVREIWLRRVLLLDYQNLKFEILSLVIPLAKLSFANILDILKHKVEG